MFCKTFVLLFWFGVDGVVECCVKRVLMGLDFVYLRNICLFGNILQNVCVTGFKFCLFEVWNILLNVCVDEPKFCLFEASEYFVKRLCHWALFCEFEG